MNDTQHIRLFENAVEPDSLGDEAFEWDEEEARKALNELFLLTDRYRSGQNFKELLNFVSNFRFYSPFNALLVHLQQPGATFVAPAYRWLNDYGRRISPGVRPLVILQPMGPVMFVYDVSDTVDSDHSCLIPFKVLHPFKVYSDVPIAPLELLKQNAIRDGVQVVNAQHGSQSAGYITLAQNINQKQRYIYGKYRDRREKSELIPVKYLLVINDNLDAGAMLITVLHELAHLYCGHLGTPNRNWWPDRVFVKSDIAEFEAECVAYLVGKRNGIDNPSAEYLAQYCNASNKMPSINLERIMASAGLLERMMEGMLEPRKEI